MISSENIAEALEFKEVNEILKLRYGNDLTSMFSYYNWDRTFGRKIFFKALWFYRENKTIDWCHIITEGQFRWTLEEIWQFRDYYNWNELTYCYSIGYVQSPSYSAVEFFEKFINYLDWNIIKEEMGEDALNFMIKYINIKVYKK